jgi:hypothetical protein
MESFGYAKAWDSAGCGHGEVLSCLRWFGWLHTSPHVLYLYVAGELPTVGDIVSQCEQEMALLASTSADDRGACIPPLPSKSKGRDASGQFSKVKIFHNCRYHILARLTPFWRAIGIAERSTMCVAGQPVQDTWQVDQADLGGSGARSISSPITSMFEPMFCGKMTKFRRPMLRRER